MRIEASSSEKAGALDRVRSELAELKSQYQSKVNALEDLSEEVANLESDNVRLSQVSSMGYRTARTRRTMLICSPPCRSY